MIIPGFFICLSNASSYNKLTPKQCHHYEQMTIQNKKILGFGFFPTPADELRQNPCPGSYIVFAIY